MSLLSIRGLDIAFDAAGGPRQVVHGIDLDVAPGEVLALVGESGSGKSVTAAAVLGLLPGRHCRARGSVRYDGRELLGLSEAELGSVRGQGVGIVFQNSLTSLDPSFRIGEQLAESIRFRSRASAAQAREEAGAWLERVRIRDATRVLRAYPHELSGGMRQRVMIAMAIMSRPRLLIADEPTTALDPTVQKEILDLLREINQRDGTAMLLITHDFGVVSYLSDRVAVMRAGRIVEEGGTRAVLDAPRHAYTASLIQAVPDMDAGRRRRPAGQVAAKPLLELDGVSRRFAVSTGWFGREGAAVQAVQPTSLQIRRGEIMGLIGESGSGKSTLARMAGRLLAPSGGTVRFDGQDVTALEGEALLPLRRRVQFVFQDGGVSLNPRRVIAGQLEDPLLRLGVARNRGEARELAVQALRRVGLGAEHLQRYPHEFSGGQRQRIGIARALAAGPDCVILDEPTSALDVSIQAQVLDLLLELREQLNLTYLFIGHNLPVIRLLCDRIAVMAQGRIVETFDADALHARERHPATRRLLDAVLPLHGVARDAASRRAVA